MTKRLLPRPSISTQETSTLESPTISPSTSTRTPTPEKCRLEYYQERLLSYNEIKGKICELYFREESKSAYQQEMLEISTKRKFGKNTKYPDEKYCDVVKKDPKFIAGLLQKGFVKPESLRDYCFLSIPQRFFK